MSLTKILRIAFASLILAFGAVPAIPAIAQDMNATIIVPDAPGGARFTGCYNVAQRLYGPYRMTFCLEQRGSYTVTGGGVTCNGRLNWSASGRTIEVDLSRTSCGNGVAWTADSMSCQGTGLFPGSGAGSIIGNAVAKVIAPNMPTINGLSCTYYPNARGEQRTQITARRMS